MCVFFLLHNFKEVEKIYLTSFTETWSMSTHFKVENWPAFVVTVCYLSSRGGGRKNSEKCLFENGRMWQHLLFPAPQASSPALSPSTIFTLAITQSWRNRVHIYDFPKNDYLFNPIGIFFSGGGLFNQAAITVSLADVDANRAWTSLLPTESVRNNYSSVKASDLFDMITICRIRLRANARQNKIDVSWRVFKGRNEERDPQARNTQRNMMLICWRKSEDKPSN